MPTALVHRHCRRPRSKLHSKLRLQINSQLKKLSKQFAKEGTKSRTHIYIPSTTWMSLTKAPVQVLQIFITKKISENVEQRQSRIKGITKRTELGDNCDGILPVDHY